MILYIYKKILGDFSNIILYIIKDYIKYYYVCVFKKKMNIAKSY